MPTYMDHVVTSLHGADLTNIRNTDWVKKMRAAIFGRTYGPFSTGAASAALPSSAILNCAVRGCRILELRNGSTAAFIDNKLNYSSVKDLPIYTVGGPPAHTIPSHGMAPP